MSRSAATDVCLDFRLAPPTSHSPPRYRLLSTRLAATPLEIRDRHHSRGNDVRRQEHHGARTAESGGNDDGNADMPRGAGDRQSGAVVGMRPAEAMPNRHCEQQQHHECHHPLPTHLDEELPVRHEERQARQGKYHTRYREDAVGETLAQRRRHRPEQHAERER